jgi:transcriptional regulator with XRE-family HTH domain
VVNRKLRVTEKFFTRLKMRRLRLGLEQEQLAQRAGVSASSISAWERGINQPTMRNVELLAGVLGVDVAWLMGDPVAHELRDAPAAPWGTPRPLNALEALSDKTLRQVTDELVRAGNYELAKLYIDELADRKKRGVSCRGVEDVLDAALEISIEAGKAAGAAKPSSASTSNKPPRAPRGSTS